MGFNIEQYELAGAYSNVSGNDALRGPGTICVKGNPVYGIPLTYAGFQMTKNGRSKISENRQICQARFATKQGTIETTPSVTIDAPKTDISTSVDTSKTAVSNGTPDVAKSKTGLYIGIGISVLAIGIITVVLLIRKK